MTALDYDRDIAPKPHRLHVVGYDDTFHAHVCTVEGSPRHIRVDLFINGDFDDSVTPHGLVGKSVEVEFTHGYLFLANDVKVVAPASSPSEVSHG